MRIPVLTVAVGIAGRGTHFHVSLPATKHLVSCIAKVESRREERLILSWAAGLYIFHCMGCITWQWGKSWVAQWPAGVCFHCFSCPLISSPSSLSLQVVIFGQILKRISSVQLWEHTEKHFHSYRKRYNHYSCIVFYYYYSALFSMVSLSVLPFTNLSLIYLKSNTDLFVCITTVIHGLMDFMEVEAVHSSSQPFNKVENC